ncbi:uncharacterized protein LOC135814162 [Sycon ciliatum]|uniref:uncharacterized protein LOC135814162 n=1 Tax=Sycon ciliatum TaxID=27933 RepID=UPI0031F65EE6
MALSSLWIGEKITSNRRNMFSSVLSVTVATLFLGCACFCVAGSNGIEWCIQPSTVRVAQDSLCTSPSLARHGRRDISWHAMRGERESAQLVLTKPDAGLLSVEFSDLKSTAGDVIPSQQLAFKQVMYVFCRKSPREHTNTSGWFSDPLLDADADGTFPIEAGSTQPVFLSVNVPRNAAAGTYIGTVQFTLQTPTAKVSDTVPLSLQVWNLTVPDLADSSFTLSFSVGGIAGRYYNGSASVQQQFYDMLTDYRMPPDRLYRHTPILPDEADYLVHTGTRWFNLLDLEMVVALLLDNIDLELKDLLEHDQFGERQRSLQWSGKCSIHGNVSNEVMEKALTILEPLVERAEAMGYANRTYIYGFDESPLTCLPAIRQVFGGAKARWPHVHTTAVLNWESIPADIPVDTWVFSYYMWDPSPTSTVRAAAEQFLKNRPDRRISFYHAVDPAAPARLNSFIDRPPLEPRLMFWDAAVTSPVVSGWLYYAVNAWNITNGSTVYVTRVNNSARSDFNVARDFGSDTDIANGDGVFIYPGQHGPVPSIRMEAFRDGAEDVELLRLISAEKAQPLVSLLIRASNDFTLDPVLLEEVRQEAARLALSS